MTPAEAELSAVYLSAFADRMEWSAEEHVAGLRAVFAAGAAAQRKADAEKGDEA